LFHVISFGLFLWMVSAFSLGAIALAGVLLVGALLIYEHSLVRANDLSRLNAAFFTTNGLISMLLLGFIVGDLLIRHAS
jgi:4-hydroxybenzoate polyprenyltransferase